MHHICIISGVPDIATPKSYLEDENIFGGEEEVAAGLLEWTPTPAQFSNGLVLELYEKFGTKKGTRLMGAVVQKIVQLVGANPRNVNKECIHKMYTYITRTKDMVQKNGATMAEKWIYLDRLTRGADLEATLHPPSSYHRLLGRLNAMEEQTSCHFCGEAGDRDRLFSCRGCLSFTYCSRRCQRQGWEGGHKATCNLYADQTFGDEAKEVPTNEEAATWRKRAAKFEALYREAHEGFVASEQAASCLKEEISRLTEELKAAKKQQTSASKSKAGIASVLARFKKTATEAVGGGERGPGEDGQDRGGGGGTAAAGGLMEKVNFAGLPHLQVVSPKSGGGRFLKLANVRGPKTQCAENLKKTALKTRAISALEAVALLAGDTHLGDKENTSNNLKIMMVEMINQKPALGREIVASNPSLTKDVFLLTPTDANKLMHSLGLSWKKTRDMSSIMARLTGCRLFPSEGRRRAALAEVTQICSTDKLHVGKLPLFKNGKAKYPTLQAYTKIADISQFMVELMAEVK